MAKPENKPVELDLEPHPADKAREMVVADNLRRHHEHNIRHIVLKDEQSRQHAWPNGNFTVSGIGSGQIKTGGGIDGRAA